MTSPQTTGWAVFLPRGMVNTNRSHTVVDIGEDASEDRVWMNALGWPTQAEIQDAKAKGARAFQCRLVEIERHE